jgi:hypothetical protein
MEYAGQSVSDVNMYIREVGRRAESWIKLAQEHLALIFGIIGVESFGFTARELATSSVLE